MNNDLELRVRVLESALGLRWNEDEKRYEFLAHRQCFALDHDAAEEHTTAVVGPDGKIRMKTIGRIE